MGDVGLPLAELRQLVVLACLVQLVQLACDFVPANEADAEGLLSMHLVVNVILLIEDVIVL